MEGRILHWMEKRSYVYTTKINGLPMAYSVRWSRWTLAWMIARLVLRLGESEEIGIYRLPENI